MAKYSPSKIKECEAWIMEHGLMDYGGAKLKDFLTAMGITYGCKKMSFAPLWNAQNNTSKSIYAATS